MKSEISKEQKIYLQNIQKRKYWILVAQISLLLLLLFIWELSVEKEYLNGFIFSSPSRVIQCFYSMLKDQSIFLHVGITLLETMISFFLIMFLTIASAILLW